MGISQRWLVEAQHQSRNLDPIAYARPADADYGIGQQSAAELGRREIGVDARIGFSERFDIGGSASLRANLTDGS